MWTRIPILPILLLTACDANVNVQPQTQNTQPINQPAPEPTQTPTSTTKIDISQLKHKWNSQNLSLDLTNIQTQADFNGDVTDNNHLTCLNKISIQSDSANTATAKISAGTFVSQPVPAICATPAVCNAYCLQQVENCISNQIQLSAQTCAATAETFDLTLTSPTTLHTCIASQSCYDLTRSD